MKRVRSSNNRPAVLWIGGTSQLTRTFIEEGFATGLSVLICASRTGWKKPQGVPAPGPCPWNSERERDGAAAITRSSAAAQIEHWPLDLTDAESTAALADLCKRRSIDVIVLGARASLVWDYQNHPHLNDNLAELLRACMSPGRGGVSNILHISSVAAVNHLR